MSRIDNLPENQLEQLLSEAEAAATELKNKQIISGGNVRFFTSDSGNQYDWQGTLPAGGQYAGAGSKILRVVATAQNMDNLFADIIFESYKGDGTRWTFGDWQAAIKNNTQPQLSRVIYEEPTNLSNSKQRKWVCGITGMAGDAAKMKFYIVASDQCDITFEVIN